MLVRLNVIYEVPDHEGPRKQDGDKIVEDAAKDYAVQIARLFEGKQEKLVHAGMGGMAWDLELLKGKE